MSGLYILDGHTPVPIDNIMEWAEMFQNTENRIVEHTQIGDVLISTVFLGMNHNWRPDDEPLLFETMIFGGDFDNNQFRYATWGEAEEGHAECVRMVNGEKPLLTEE